MLIRVITAWKGCVCAWDLFARFYALIFLLHVLSRGFLRLLQRGEICSLGAASQVALAPEHP